MERGATVRITIDSATYRRKPYDLTVAENGLHFAAEKPGQNFDVAYGDICDFQVTDSSRGNPRFTMQTRSVMLSGNIIDPQDISDFTSALKEKFVGFINIEVRKY